LRIQSLDCNHYYGGFYGLQVLLVDCVVIVYAEHNLVPVANAGADKTVWLPVKTVTLDGSNSTDDQQISSYQWTCQSYRFMFYVLFCQDVVHFCWLHGLTANALCSMKVVALHQTRPTQPAISAWVLGRDNEYQ